MPTKKRVTRRPRRGGNLVNKINDLAKKTKILSEGLNMLPYAPARMLGTMAGNMGYGRRKPVRRKGRGFGWLGDILGNVAKPFAGGLMGATAGLANGLGQIGHGIKRRPRR